MKASRTVAIITLLSATAGPALAQRVSTPSLSCRSASSMVTRLGAVVLGTGPDIYDRYVVNESFCPTGFYARPAFLPTRDNPQCFVGYYCSGITPFPGR
jgi:hypothetical protein